MKHCSKCDAEYEADEMFCQRCGEKLVNGENTPAYCKYCGCELVNEYERGQGCCVNCEDVPRASITSKTIAQSACHPAKYQKRLKAAEILNYIAGVIGMIAIVAASPSFALVAVLVLIVCICNGALYGAIREILKRL